MVPFSPAEVAEWACSSSNWSICGSAPTLQIASRPGPLSITSQGHGERSFGCECAQKTSEVPRLETYHELLFYGLQSQVRHNGCCRRLTY